MSKAINFFGAGLLIGFVAFWLTSLQPVHTYLGPAGLSRVHQAAGFDPWTGMGYGRLYEVADFTGSGEVVPWELVREPGFKTWFGTNHAVPVPVGAIAAWVAILAILAGRRRRERLVVGEVGVEPTRPSRDTGS